MAWTESVINSLSPLLSEVYSSPGCTWVASELFFFIEPFAFMVGLKEDLIASDISTVWQGIRRAGKDGVGDCACRLSPGHT
jgi:hypothetical protein